MLFFLSESSGSLRVWIGWILSIYLTIIFISLQTVKPTVSSDKVRIRQLLCNCLGTYFQRGRETKEWPVNRGNEKICKPNHCLKTENGVTIHVISRSCQNHDNYQHRYDFTQLASVKSMQEDSLTFTNYINTSTAS